MKNSYWLASISLYVSPYLIRNLSPPDKTRIGKIIINLIKNSYIGHSEFNRMWLLHCFTQETEWDCEDDFLKLYKNSKASNLKSVNSPFKSLSITFILVVFL